MQIISAEKKDAKTISKLAKIIWNEHYSNIVKISLIKYMLKEFQSENAIIKQIENGYKYFLIKENNEYYGYFSFKEEQNKLFLSKLYIVKEARGKGFSRQIIDFLIKEAKFKNINSIYLTVNKNNSSTIMIYEKLGFIKKDSIITDIGNGYFMDDFVYCINF
jgi:RimJ/RimL family protein N-acetyltransferase